MSKEKVMQIPVLEEGQEQEQEQELTVSLELHIKVMSNGGIQIDVPEGSEQLEPIQVEGITRTVYEQLRDVRIAQQAVEMFKARLG